MPRVASWEGAPSGPHRLIGLLALDATGLKGEDGYRGFYLHFHDRRGALGLQTARRQGAAAAPPGGQGRTAPGAFFRPESSGHVGMEATWETLEVLLEHLHVHLWALGADVEFF